MTRKHLTRPHRRISTITLSVAGTTLLVAAVVALAATLPGHTAATLPGHQAARQSSGSRAGETAALAASSVAASSEAASSVAGPSVRMFSRVGSGQRTVALPDSFQTIEWRVQLLHGHSSRARQAHAAQQATLLAARHQAAQRQAAQRQAAQRHVLQQPATATAAVAGSAGSAGSVGSAGSAQQIALAMLGSYGWSSGQFSCLDQLWTGESGWNTFASNPSSGAYGIPQALPGSKMASAGADWQTDPATQIRWGLGYIRGLYGSPCGAWAHEKSVGWY